MRFHRTIQLTFLLFTAAVSSVPAAVVYNEAISGDLSNNGLTPTPIVVALGSNQIFGTTGRGAAGIDRDYFTITVPAGLGLSGITVLPVTTVGGSDSFIGIQAGNQVTVPTNATDATGLLGWLHYDTGDINTNILPEMSVPALGSSGFNVPLGAGSYSFWVQEFSSGSFNYGFDLTLAPVPEPGTCAAVLGGLAAVVFLRRRRLS